MKKVILAAAMTAVGALTMMAGTPETMYLIKDDYVVGKYDVDKVDYVSFNLPEGVTDSNVILDLGTVGKNSVTYTVSTVGETVAYAHGIIAAPYLDALALSYEGDMFDNLDEEFQVVLMQEILTYDAYLGMGTDTYTMKDWQLVGDTAGSRFSVLSGTDYYLCAWELDPLTYEPRETFVYTKFSTLPGEETSASFSCGFVGQNEYGMQFAFSGDSNIAYVRTAYGEAELMDIYMEYYGIDFLMAAFGVNWSIDYLNQTGEVEEGVSNSIWPAYAPGDYVMVVRAYDTNGDYKQVILYVTAEGETAEGPQITVYSREKGEFFVKVNFEISPNNVQEAYVRLMSENTVDDRLNIGYTLAELAMGGDATDITDEINSTGEYTYTNNDLEEMWYSLLIFAKDSDGHKTTQRLSFYPDNDSRFATYEPVYETPARKAARTIRNRNNPTLKKLGK